MSAGIGGFFALESFPARRNSLLAHWSPPGSSLLIKRYNARSALKARLGALGAKRIWLPSYCCLSLAEAVPSACTARFYALDEQLQAIPSELDRQVGADDVVLIIDYFGRLPTPAVRSWAASRQDVHWVEDRAHVLDSGQLCWGDDVLYSPRKVCGVSDGGLLFVRRQEQATPGVAMKPPPEFYADAALERLQEQSGLTFGRAYQRYLHQEQAMTADDHDMSELSWGMLRALPWRPLVVSRRRNYRYLQGRLARNSFLGELGPLVPSHFVLRVKRARDVAARLNEVGVFAQRHWAELAAPERFETAHLLSQELLSLPCDHRYGLEHMKKIVQALRAIL